MLTCFELADVSETDPGLLKKHSTFKSYTTVRFTYPCIRTFYHPHPQAEKLPSKPTPLPLLVFVHGLGGSLAQFHLLLTSFVNIGPCLGIDLPGCGRSAFSPDDWAAYSTESLVLLLEAVIDSYLNKEEGQGFILIAHSMGCSLSALLASNTSPIPSKTRKHALGLVAICPKAEPPSRKGVDNYQMLLSIPDPIFNIFRMWDRRGGLQSASVNRFVGKNGDEDTKKLQERYNSQSRTPVWRRMAKGALPIYDDQGSPHGGFPGLLVWGGLQIPLFLIAGESDQVTKPKELQKIAEFISKKLDKNSVQSQPNGALLEESQLSGLSNEGRSNGKSIENKAGDQPQSTKIDLLKNSESPDMDEQGGVVETDAETMENAKGNSSGAQQDNAAITVPLTALKTTILPSPASHAMLFDYTVYRTLAGLIQTFLAEKIDYRLSLGWQLQHLSTSGKWDVKNLVKWQKAPSVSEPIGGVFRAMKTLRGVDEVHSPKRFVQGWKEKIYAVIDISHDSPVYDPADLQNGGIEYHKFPTVSKIPPTRHEVKDFIALVERIRTKAPTVEGGREAPVIGVHCHYGFNRTGFFLVCYLIEKMDYPLERAIDEFAEKRPPGIKHSHFMNELFVRYTKGIKRSPTG
jgi:pimeloyl-ACP methyl ester carboxylesterase/protein-tyrosine phosphatase